MSGEALPLAVVGCDFRVASTSWRDALLLDADARTTLAAALGKASGAAGLVVLETCNRVEWIVDADQPAWAAELARAQMMARWRDLEGPLPQPYLHVGDAAAEHLVRVALGMESFVLGEREIAGQLNRAMAAARRQGLTTAHLGALQTTLGRAVKRVQRLTRFGATSRGVHGLAIDRLRATLGPPPQGSWQIGVLGMGEIGRKAASLAERVPGWQVLRGNRSTAGTRWTPLPDFVAGLGALDALIVATGARRPVLSAATLSARGGRPLVVVDLGAPPQVEKGAADVQLLGLDELLDTSRPESARHYDRRDLQRAEEIAADAVAEFRAACRKQDVAPLLRGVWDAYDGLTHERLPALLDAHVGEALGPAERARLQVALRDALRGYTRGVIDAIEDALER